MEKMLRSGDVTVVLVYSPSCPHCHTYMPLWKKLTQNRNRSANMVSIQADAYDQTSLKEKAPVSAVPTVLYVDNSGKVVEVEEARDMNKMNTLITQKPATPTAIDLPEIEMPPVASPVIPAAIMPQPLSQPKPNLTVELPKTEPSELNVVPALPISTMPVTEPAAQVGGSRQRGGDPMSAFLLAAQQAAPAAVLLGAYAAYGRARRSSGLAAPVRSRKARALLRRLRARRTHRK